MEPHLSAAARADAFSTNLLAAVLALVPEGVAVVNGDGHYVMVGPGFTRHFGWHATQVLGCHFTEFLDQADHAEAQARHAEARESGAEYERQGRLRCADGSMIPIKVRSRTVESGGKLFRVVLLCPEPKPQPRLVVAGKLQLVGLDRVRDHLGARWESVAERVFATAESVIRHKMDRRDTLSRGEDGFLVCFAGLNAQEAAVKAATLSEEITRRLVGEIAESAARAVSFTAEIPVPAEVDGTEAITRLLHRGLAEAQARALSTADTLLKESAGKASLRPEPVLHANGRHSEFVIAELDDGVDGRLERLAALGWTEQEPDLPAELILLRLGLVCAWAASAERSTILLPACWASLSQRRILDRFARALCDVPRALRERISVELRDIPADVPRSRLGEVIAALRTLGHPPSVELPSPAAFRLLEGVVQRLALVTMHADSLLLPGVKRAEALIRELAAWRARLLVRGVDQEEQVTALYALGVPLVAGRALGGGDPRH